MSASPLGENLAGSVGGILGLWVAVGLLALDMQHAAVWMRVSINLLAALASLLCVYVFAGFILDRTTGHRWMHYLALIYFLGRALAHCLVAFTWLTGAEHAPLWVSMITNSSEIMLATFYFATRADLTTTYRRSEEQRKRNIRKLENVGQLAMNLEYMMKLQGQASEKLTELIENVGRGD